MATRPGKLIPNQVKCEGDCRMATISSAGPVSQYVRDHLAKVLDEKRVVVWFDGERAFANLVADLGLANCVIVPAEPSILRGRGRPIRMRIA